MKQRLNRLLLAPKIVIGVVSIGAIIVGVVSSIVHKRTLDERFAGLENTQQAITSTYGNESSSKDLTLAFPVGGRIKNVLVKIGDSVKAGDILASLDSDNALGAINQAKAAYSSAKTAYDKLVNGASTPDIDIAKVALNNAKNTYTNTVAQQKVLVASALSAMLSTGLVAQPTLSGATTISPIISGAYTGTEEGTYTIKTYITGAGLYYSVSGLEQGGDMPVSSLPSPLGTRGLYIQFLSNTLSANTTWTVAVPNNQAPSYLAYKNAYQSALQNQAQAVATAQGAVDAAQASLNQKLAGARIEDLNIARAQVENTQGALQIAEGSYRNTIITAPVDGKVTNVSITAGQIATPNIAAIEILSK